MMDRLNAAKQAVIELCRASRKKHNITLVTLGAMTGFHYSALSVFEHGSFHFDKAHGYYKNVFDEEEKELFERLIDDIKEAYLYESI